MQRFIWILLIVAVWAGAGNSQDAAKPMPVFAIHGPTVVAFFPPVTQQDLSSNPDTNEALSDFQFYNGKVSTPLHNAGVEFREANTLSFRTRIGTTVRIYRTGKAGIGYYFIAPGKEPNIVSGVMTDEDLLDAARKYFGITIH
jgi:hypothetical protein